MKRITRNLIGKLGYLLEILQNYKDWQVIFINRIFGVPVSKSKLRNGLIIAGGKNSNISDLIYEIFIKKIYNPESLEIQKGDVVLDIGANIGVFSLYAARLGADKIYSIEPLSENVKLIKNNFRINEFEFPKIINLAVSNKNGKSKIYLGDLDSHASLNKKNKSGQLVVATSTLEKIFKDYKIRRVDFLKIDCEGSEGDIFRSTKTSVWNKVRKIALEYHDDTSSLSHKEIINKLITMNFKTKLCPSGKQLGYIYAKRV